MNIATSYTLYLPVTEHISSYNLLRTILKISPSINITLKGTQLMHNFWQQRTLLTNVWHQASCKPFTASDLAYCKILEKMVNISKCINACWLYLGWMDKSLHHSRHSRYASIVTRIYDLLSLIHGISMIEYSDNVWNIYIASIGKNMNNRA